MYNSWAFCIYQTLWKNLTDHQINQIKNLIKLILRLFYHVMAVSCNNDKKNMITKSIYNVTLYYGAQQVLQTFSWWHFETFLLIQNSYLTYWKYIWKLVDIDSRKYMQRWIKSPTKHGKTIN